MRRSNLLLGRSEVVSKRFLIELWKEKNELDRMAKVTVQVNECKLDLFCRNVNSEQVRERQKEVTSLKIKLFFHTLLLHLILQNRSHLFLVPQFLHLTVFLLNNAFPHHFRNVLLVLAHLMYVVPPLVAHFSLHRITLLLSRVLIY
jgi:hypothetical protein